MSEVKYDIALDSKGNYVTILDAEKGSKYFCPECKGEFVVRKGKIRAWHFAHKGEVPSSCKGESAKHALMKHKLYYLFSRIDKAYIVYSCKKCGKYHYKSISIKRVNIEEDVGAVRPDLLITTTKNNKIAIEVVYRNPVDSEKIEKFKREGISFLEIWCNDNYDFLNEVVKVKTPILFPVVEFSDETIFDEEEQKISLDMIREELTNETNNENVILLYRNSYLIKSFCLFKILEKMGYKIIGEGNIDRWIDKIRQNSKHGTIFEVKKRLGIIFAETKELGKVALNMQFYRGSDIYETLECILMCDGVLDKSPFVDWTMFIGRNYGALFFGKYTYEDIIEIVDEVFGDKNGSKRFRQITLSNLFDDETEESDFELSMFVELLNKIKTVTKIQNSPVPKMSGSKVRHKDVQNLQTYLLRPEEILKILEELGKPITGYELSNLLGVPVRKVLKVLDELVSLGEVERNRWYYYKK